MLKTPRMIRIYYPLTKSTVYRGSPLNLFNMWLEYLGYPYKKQILLSEIYPDNENFSPCTGNYIKVDCLTFFFMTLRGQIV